MVVIQGGNGSCQDSAIIIEGCNNIEGVSRQYDEMKKRFGNYKMLKRALIKDNDKMYDKFILDINGQERIIYFDITDFFGKY
ncbi:MAG: hypothetical protein GF311_01250 [Candidatus Lokiarchaeota archaeon]|nr:hypothetical protein [Candidatus Lokiarchaeota archaeon]